jgi:uncharacterized protein
VIVLLAHAMAVILIGVVPVLAVRRYRKLSEPGVGSRRRQALLFRSVVFKWALVPPLLVVWASAGYDSVFLWGSPDQRWLGGVLILAAIAGAVVVAVRLRSVKQRARIGKAVENIASLLPTTPSERRVFAVAAVTAGITEEIAYRAFLIAYIAWLLSPISWTGATVIAGALFGAVHLYQGWKGIFLTGLLGVLFGLLYAEVGLLVLIVVHTLIDLRVLLLPSGPAARN